MTEARPGSCDAQPWWSAVDDERTTVRVDDRDRWLLAQDLDSLTSPPHAAGVRMLPRDPLLQLRDRASLVPDRDLHRQVWKTVGEPGTVLVDGRLAAAWRPRKQGRKLSLTVETFTGLTPAQREQIETEADAMGTVCGCTSVEVGFTS